MKFIHFFTILITLFFTSSDVSAINVDDTTPEGIGVFIGNYSRAVPNTLRRKDFFCHSRDLDACKINEDGVTYTCEYYFVVESRLTMRYEVDQAGWKTSFPVMIDEGDVDNNGYSSLFYTYCGAAFYPRRASFDRCNLTETEGPNPAYISRNDNAFIGADGVQREITVINGLLPGPTICAGWKDTIKVHVTNGLAGFGFEDVTIHWHGMFQRGTPWHDGVGFVSQCPISQGQSFTYEFEANPAGTFWYHSHVGLQYGDGVFGAMVIFDDPELRVAEGHYSSHPEVPDNIMVLSDWKHELSSTGFLKHPLHWVSDDGVAYEYPLSIEGSMMNGEPFVSGLWNGQGSFGNGMEPYVFYVNPGQRVRFRLLCAMANNPYRVSIDGHKLTLLAMDGWDVVPMTEVDAIICYPAERYDFTLDLRAAATGEYLVRAETLIFPDLSPKEPTPYPVIYAILSVTDRPVMEIYDDPNLVTPPFPNTTSSLDDCDEFNECLVMNCPWGEYYIDNPSIKCLITADFDIHPNEYNQHKNPPDPYEDGIEDRIIYVNYNVLGNWTTELPNVDGIFLQLPPTVPLTQTGPTYTLDECEGPTAYGTPGSFEHCPRYLTLEYDKTYIFVMTNRWPDDPRGQFNIPGAMPHPTHMHGHSFYVLAESAGTIVPGAKENQSLPVEGGGALDNGCITGGWGSPSDYCYDWQTRNGSLICTQGWGNCTFNDFFNDVPLKSVDEAPRRDTIVLPPHGWVVLAIRADNPGWWIWHCHIENHLAYGMGVMLNEAPDETKELVKRDLPANFPTCDDYAANDRTQLESIMFMSPTGSEIPLHPPFEPKVMEYTAEVSYEVDYLGVMWSPDLLGQSVHLNGASFPTPSLVGLAVGENPFEISVQNEAVPGSSRTYSFHVTRLTADNTDAVGQPQPSDISRIHLSTDDDDDESEDVELVPEFDELHQEYTAEVPATVEEIKVTIHGDQPVTINGIPNLVWANIALGFGNNGILIQLEDGRSYTINVFRDGSDDDGGGGDDDGGCDVGDDTTSDSAITGLAVFVALLGAIILAYGCFYIYKKKTEGAATFQVVENESQVELQET